MGSAFVFRVRKSSKSDSIFEELYLIGVYNGDRICSSWGVD
jgi:hypothetical protein